MAYMARFGGSFRLLSSSLRAAPIRSLEACKFTLQSRRYAVASVAPVDFKPHVGQPLEADADAILSEEPDVVEDGAEVADAGMRFKDLEGVISKDTLKAIMVRPFKFEHMTPVQEAVLSMLPKVAEPFNKEGTAKQARDLLVRAKTGTGKTLAFLVPAIEARLQAIDAYVKEQGGDSSGRARRSYMRSRVGILIISPTRELATQIANEAVKLATHIDDFEVRLFTGGVSKRMQMRDWSRGSKDIVVTTPGRIRDLIESERDVKDALQYTQTLILDEADTLLDMGFRDDIDAISSVLPQGPERQTFLFSATIDKRVEQVARATLDKHYTYINTVSEDTSPVHAHVPQFHTVLPSATEQIPHVLRLLAHDQLINAGKSKTIMFFNTTKMTQLFATLMRELSKSVLPAGSQTKIYEIHSKKEQKARSNTSDRFRNDTSGASVLITSDVSARGVDYPGVSRVIQVGIPGSSEQYIHRVGRTGRAGGVVGRGDLVLLPWEVGFLTHNMQGVPLKPVTFNEIQKQVTELAAKFDAEAGNSPSNDRRSSNRYGPIQLKAPVTPNLEAMPKEIEELLSSIEEQAVEETFASMLGFYTGKSQELRSTRSAIVQGIKDWTVEACGLPKPPYVSDAFLSKLGVFDDSARKFGRGGGDRGGGGRGGSGMRRGDSNSSARWGGRGRQGSQDRAPRRDFEDRAPRGDFGDRAPRGDFGERAPRRDFGDRAPRRDFGDRAPRRDFGDREPGQSKQALFGPGGQINPRDDRRRNDRGGGDRGRFSNDRRSSGFDSKKRTVEE